MANATNKVTESVRSGIPAGSAIAVSWSVNEPVPWTIIHGLLSWTHVLY